MFSPKAVQGRVGLKLGVLLLAFYPGAKADPKGPFDHSRLEAPASVALELPARSAGAKTGSEFLAELGCVAPNLRESKIMTELATGNTPAFLRELKPVRIPYLRSRHRQQGEESPDPAQNGPETKVSEAVLYVTADYLSVGSDLDYVLVPLNFYSAQKIAEQWQMLLPTAKMVADIYAQADCQLEPQPLPPGPQMTSSAYIAQHDQQITRQREAESRPGGGTQLIAGHKKDIVVSRQLKGKPERIAIYGWHRKNGRPIQPISTVHAATYADYSHGVRLVYPYLWLEGQWTAVAKILASKEWAYLLSGEGALNVEDLLPGCAVLRAQPRAS